MSAAHVRCMQVLEMPDKEWEYIVLLQVCIYQLFKHKNLIKNICSFQNGNRLNIKADLPSKENRQNMYGISDRGPRGFAFESDHFT